VNTRPADAQGQQNRPFTSATPVFVKSVDEPARAPYQHNIGFNQGPSTCGQFYCEVVFPAVPAGKRLEVTYVSALFGAPGGHATIEVRLSSNFFSAHVYLPLPQDSGFHTYVGSGPLTFFVEAGENPTVVLGGYDLDTSEISADVMIVGHLVSVP